MIQVFISYCIGKDTTFIVLYSPESHSFLSSCFPKFLCLSPLPAPCVEHQKVKGCKAISYKSIYYFSMFNSWMQYV